MFTVTSCKKMSKHIFLLLLYCSIYFCYINLLVIKVMILCRYQSKKKKVVVRGKFVFRQTTSKNKFSAMKMHLQKKTNKKKTPKPNNSVRLYTF